MPGDRLVFYSLAVTDLSRASLAVRQLLRSTASLREHNRSIPVRLYLHGALDPGDRAELAGLGVDLRDMGSDEALLARFAEPRVVEALARYPILHKEIGLSYLEEEPARQILYADSDTFFFTDVERLFDRCTERDLYAREAPGAAVPAALADRLGARAVPVCNAGVFLFNHGSWRRLAARMREVCELIFRFSVGITAQPPAPRELPDLAYLREHRHRLVTPEDERAALPLPPVNPWTRDEIAIALLLGTMPDLSVGLLSPREILQAEEFERAGEEPSLLAHYFSVNTRRFHAWRAERGLRADPAGEERRQAALRARKEVSDPGARLLLGLLQSAPDRAAIEAAVARAHPGDVRSRILEGLAYLSGHDRIGVDLGDGLNRCLVEALLDGCEGERLHARLSRTYERATVESQREALGAHVARLRATLLAPLLGA